MVRANKAELAYRRNSCSPDNQPNQRGRNGAYNAQARRLDMALSASKGRESDTPHRSY
jgi:hypothetical protein